MQSAEGHSLSKPIHAEAVVPQAQGLVAVILAVSFSCCNGNSNLTTPSQHFEVRNFTDNNSHGEQLNQKKHESCAVPTLDISIASAIYQGSLIALSTLAILNKKSPKNFKSEVGGSPSRSLMALRSRQVSTRPGQHPTQIFDVHCSR